MWAWCVLYQIRWAGCCGGFPVVGGTHLGLYTHASHLQHLFGSGLASTTPYPHPLEIACSIITAEVLLARRTGQVGSQDSHSPLD